MQQIPMSVTPDLASQLMQLGLDALLKQQGITFAQSAPVPALGEHWPGEGGRNGGLIRGDNGAADYYLIVPDFPETRAAWGGYGHEVDGAASHSDGQANTKALLADGEDYPAAKIASELTVEGHRDCYLPARRELQVLEANVPELFAKGYHWCSTQFSADSAYSMAFEDGWLNDDGKLNERLVRPVRRKYF